MTWYRNSVRHISLCFFWRDSCSAQYSDSGSNLFFFNDVYWLFEWSRGRLDKI